MVSSLRASTASGEQGPATPAKVAFTPKQKLRLWVAGDSLVITPGYSIVRAAAALQTEAHQVHAQQ